MAVSQGEALQAGGPMVTSQATPMEVLLEGRRVGVSRWLVYVVASLTVGISAFHLYTGGFSQIDYHLQRVLVLGLLLVGTYLLYPSGRKRWSDRPNLALVFDVIMILGVIGATVYAFLLGSAELARPQLTTWDMIFGTITVVAILDCTRRTIDWSVVILALIIILLNFLGPWLPGGLYAPSFSWERQLMGIYLGGGGIFGEVMAIMTDYLVMFFLFAGILRATGVLDRFQDVAFAVAGRYSGGPAKAAVVGSAFFGMISGSSNSNVAVTGSFTIPMMKKLGFKPEWAGAIEAVASMGGNITPPVMGTTVFLMIQFVGVSYATIAAAAALPAILYYVCLFLQVHFEGKRLGLQGMPKDEVPPLLPALIGVWPALLSIAALLFFLAQGYGLAFSIYGTVLITVAVSLLNKKVRQDPSRFILAFEEGGRTSVSIGPILATSGIILAAASYSGLPTWFASNLSALAGDSILMALIIAAVVSFVLGTGLPGLLAYIVVYVTVIPALIQMGVPELAAHLFAFYYAMVGVITPPSAATAYTAAALAGASPMATAWVAMRLALAAYVVPFAFALSPALILQGSVLEIVWAFVAALVAVSAVAAGFVGYKMNLAQRIGITLGGTLLLVPGSTTLLAGGAVLGLSLLPYFSQTWRRLFSSRASLSGGG